MDPKPYQQEYLFGRECLRINKSLCADKSYAYYDYVKFGYSHLFFISLIEQSARGVRKQSRGVEGQKDICFFDGATNS